MINPISSSNPAAITTQQSPAAAPPPPPATNPQDSVHISRQALAASGDVDHDGDSH